MAFLTSNNDKRLIIKCYQTSSDFGWMECHISWATEWIIYSGHCTQSLENSEHPFCPRERIMWMNKTFLERKLT